jgi:serine/threonine protein kinase
VYFVAQRSDGRRAVLRITDAPDLPNPPTAPDEASRSSGDNAAAEGAILARLNHPAIPKVLGAWEYNGRGYLAREYFEGDDLGTYVRRHGPLSRERLLDITLQLCDVLTYIHSQSPAVIHRDIKPENIILSAGNSVKLIDFGIARDFKPDTNMSRDTQVAGTRPYMAPEQFGSEQTDGRADIYALGVVMIYVATGKPDKTNLRASYPYKELMPLIETCIRKDRDQRFKTAAQLKRRILWIRQRITQKILLVAGACALVAVAFVAGLLIGQAQGFTRGVDSIMDVPTYKNRPFTPDELYEPVTFDNWYIDMAVRVTLNKTPEDTIYRNDVVSHIDKIVIYGTHILHPSLDVKLIKTHLEKDAVSYMTDDGFTVERGDISSLDDIPTMYYLRSLTLTSQSITDLSPLSGMKLEEVNLTDNYVGNLLPLKDMVTLRELDVSQNPLRDLTPISRLLSLTSLDISQTQVTDLAPLRELTKLETLKLAYCDVRDISVLAKMPDLQEVDVSNTLVTDLSPLVRPGNPVTVRCVGLPKEVVDKVRDKTGIVIIDQPSENQR